MKTVRPSLGCIARRSAFVAIDSPKHNEIGGAR